MPYVNDNINGTSSGGILPYPYSEEFEKLNIEHEQNLARIKRIHDNILAGLKNEYENRRDGIQQDYDLGPIYAEQNRNTISSLKKELMSVLANIEDILRDSNIVDSIVYELLRDCRIEEASLQNNEQFVEQIRNYCGLKNELDSLNNWHPMTDEERDTEMKQLELEYKSEFENAEASYKEQVEAENADFERRKNDLDEN